MTIDFNIDQTTILLKERIDQLFEIESEINQRKGIPESFGASLWSEYSDVRKYIWLDGDHVVIIGKSSNFYRIFLDQLGHRTCIFHLSVLEDDTYKLITLRYGPWVQRFDQYVTDLAAKKDQLGNDYNANQDDFQPIDF
ncbi:hypothetical protein F4V57_01290 [Acinetobacter qingfengensis]|uniref:Uncharacterized protein n=1 Tax=Acinetobacter qingfengensis TaxID=1262585 RepID=A0A1E7R9B9_9GAMM|nr:hypothetical protein [Acinetobacter qingfengensis]KAA8735464.1 hypothetical protein F4V57_01290 [Acinetobacter qingfengensis]OEY95891.1 hypothetical protein BJI46_02960 [Acinetobacter qingfengensis]